MLELIIKQYFLRGIDDKPSNKKWPLYVFIKGSSFVVSGTHVQIPGTFGMTTIIHNRDNFFQDQQLFSVRVQI